MFEMNWKAGQSIWKYMNYCVQNSVIKCSDLQHILLVCTEFKCLYEKMFCSILYEICSHFNYFKCYWGASFLLKCLLSSKVTYSLYLLLEYNQCLHLLKILFPNLQCTKSTSICLCGFFNCCVNRQSFEENPKTSTRSKFIYVKSSIIIL